MGSLLQYMLTFVRMPATFGSIIQQDQRLSQVYLRHCDLKVSVYTSRKLSISSLDEIDHQNASTDLKYLKASTTLRGAFLR